MLSKKDVEDLLVICDQLEEEGYEYVEALRDIASRATLNIYPHHNFEATVMGWSGEWVVAGVEVSHDAYFHRDGVRATIELHSMREMRREI